MRNYLDSLVCCLAYCFKGFTVYKGNFYLISFHNIGSDLEKKSVYSRQGNKLRLLPSHSVRLQTDHFSISGCTILVSFKLFKNQPFLFLIKARSSITSSRKLPVSVTINSTSWHTLKFLFHSVIFRY